MATTKKRIALVHEQNSDNLIGLFTVKTLRPVFYPSFIEKDIYAEFKKALKDKDLSKISSLGIVRKQGVVNRLIENQ